MKLQRFVLLIIKLVAVVFGVRLEKRRLIKPKAIDFSSKYYQSKFSFCKPFRHLNPVESVKAHRLATDVFRRCGPQLVVPFATTYNAPAFALNKLSEMFSVGLTVIFARIANDGGVKTPENTSYTELRYYARMLSRIFLAPDLQLSVQHRGKTYKYPPVGMYYFFNNMSFCAFNEEQPPNRDLDFYKHTVNHFCFIVL